MHVALLLCAFIDTFNFIFLESSAQQDLLFPHLHQATTRWQQAAVRTLGIRSLRSFLPQWHQHLTVKIVQTILCQFEIAKWAQKANEWESRRTDPLPAFSEPESNPHHGETISDISDTSKACVLPVKSSSYRILVKPLIPGCPALGIC